MSPRVGIRFPSFASWMAACAENTAELIKRANTEYFQY
jgi:hypothetical protein